MNKIKYYSNKKLKELLKTTLLINMAFLCVYLLYSNIIRSIEHAIHLKSSLHKMIFETSNSHRIEHLNIKNTCEYNPKQQYIKLDKKIVNIAKKSRSFF